MQPVRLSFVFLRNQNEFCIATVAIIRYSIFDSILDTWNIAQISSGRSTIHTILDISKYRDTTKYRYRTFTSIAILRYIEYRTSTTCDLYVGSPPPHDLERLRTTMQRRVVDFVRVGYFIPLNGPLTGHPPSMTLYILDIIIMWKIQYIFPVLLWIKY